MAKVFIGVGHGGRDYGACANGLKESEIVLDIALEMNKILKQHGVDTMISRTTQGTDALDDLSPKIQRCNEYAPDLAVDIHINAGGGIGFEAFYYHGGGTSLKLAQEIEKEVKAMGQYSRGLKTRLNASGNDYFGFIRQIAAPSVILEAAFIDNIDDVEKIRTIEGRKNFAVAYAKGVLNTLGIPYNKNSVASDCGAITGRYDTLEQIPAGEFRNTIAELMEKGIIKGGTDGKLNLSDDMVRMFVINNRAGLYK